MPGILGRLGSVLKATMTRALDAAEDPGALLDMSYEQMQGQLQQVRQSIAEVASAKARLDGQFMQMHGREQQLDEQARQALALGREDLARLALERRAALAPQRAVLANQVESLEQQQTALIEGEAVLADRLVAFKVHKDVMKAQYSAAQANVRLQEAATGLSREMSEVRLSIERAQDKIAATQAQANALEGLASGAAFPSLALGGSDDIAAELARLTRPAEIEARLQALKGSLSLTTEAPPLSLPQGQDRAPTEAPPAP